MCKYCTDGYTTLINSTKLEENIIGWDKTMLATELDDMDNSVVFEIRNGIGYIRLGDRGDMQCLDHGDKVKIDTRTGQYVERV